MSKTIQFELSDELFEMVRRRAEVDGLSIPDFLLNSAGAFRAANPMTREEMQIFIREVPPCRDHNLSAADIIRDMRGPVPEDDVEYQRYLLKHRGVEGGTS